MVQLHAGVERQHARSRLLVVGIERVRSGVLGIKPWVRLEDEVRLSGEPDAFIAEMGKDGVRRGGYWRYRSFLGGGRARCIRDSGVDREGTHIGGSECELRAVCGVGRTRGFAAWSLRGGGDADEPDEQKNRDQEANRSNHILLKITPLVVIRHAVFRAEVW